MILLNLNLCSVSFHRCSGCESASNLDPTPIESQIVEAEAELLFLSVFDRLPTVTPLFFEDCVSAKSYSGFARGLSWTPMHSLSPRTIAHTVKVYSPHRCDIQEKA